MTELMRISSSAMIAIAVAGSLQGLALGESVTVNFSGVVESRSRNDLGAAGFTPGGAFRGSFRFDTNFTGGPGPGVASFTPLLDAREANITLTFDERRLSGPSGASVSGGVDFRTNALLPAVTVRDGTAIGGGDSFTIFGRPFFRPVAPLDISVELRDPTGLALSSAALPRFFSTALFPESRVTLTESPFGITVGRITSIGIAAVPEPSSAVLAGVGALALAAGIARRRRRAG